MVLSKKIDLLKKAFLTHPSNVYIKKCSFLKLSLQQLAHYKSLLEPLRIIKFL